MQKKIVIIILFLASLIKAQEQNSNAKNQFSTDKLNLISVTVGGSFIVNGTFPASITERADQFITRLFNEARNAALNVARDEVSQAKAVEQIAKYSRRDITLKRLNGEVIKLDLEKFRLTGDFKYNPYLKNDDVIIFPEADLDRNYVIVEGAVNLPVKFQFVQGDKLSDAILFARGVSLAFENVNDVEVYRLDKTGNNEEIIKAGISDVVDLKSGDRIRVLAEESNRKDYRVLVLGEVKNPGYIFVKKNNSTIKEVIERAGGFTQNASLDNSEILRGGSGSQILRMKSIVEQYEKNPEKKILQNDTKYDYNYLETLLMSRSADLVVEDSSAFVIDNALRLMHSPGLVDFNKVLVEGSRESKFSVHDGDIILIPFKEDLVFMFGQVNNPGFVKYEEGANYKYYISQAGGIGESAEEEVKIIKAKSRAWIEAKENTVIAPGDFIYVPKDISHKWSYYLKDLSTVTSILGTVVSFISLIIVVSK